MFLGRRLAAGLLDIGRDIAYHHCGRLNLVWAVIWVALLVYDSNDLVDGDNTRNWRRLQTKVLWEGKKNLYWKPHDNYLGNTLYA